MNFIGWILCFNKWCFIGYILFNTFLWPLGVLYGCQAEAAETRLVPGVKMKCAVASNSLIQEDYHFLFQFVSKWRLWPTSRSVLPGDSRCLPKKKRKEKLTSDTESWPRHKVEQSRRWSCWCVWRGSHMLDFRVNVKRQETVLTVVHQPTGAERLFNKLSTSNQ